jgi:hypothetical protein
MEGNISELVALMARCSDDAETQRGCCERILDLLADVDGEICATLVEAIHTALNRHTADGSLQVCLLCIVFCKSANANICALFLRSTFKACCSSSVGEFSKLGRA